MKIAIVVVITIVSYTVNNNNTNHNDNNRNNHHHKSGKNRCNCKILEAAAVHHAAAGTRMHTFQVMRVSLGGSRRLIEWRFMLSHIT